MDHIQQITDIKRNILVTGGSGFIGSNTILYFMSKYPNYRIINLDKMDYCASENNLREISSNPNYRFIRGNILSVDLVRFILEEELIDIVIHFAAQSHVDNSFGNALSFIENNVNGTAVLLECCKQYGNIKRFIHVSTDEVYGSVPAMSIATEQSTMDPTNPYSASKAAAEMVVKSYYHSFKVPIIITRSNNVYGPRQFPEKIIPKFIHLAHLGEKLPIHGNGTALRNYIYIDDIVRAFDIILHKGIIGEIYNIGSDTEKTAVDVARDILKEFGSTNANNSYYNTTDRCFNDKRYTMCDEKIRQLGWQNMVSWSEGLSHTIKWYTQNINHWPDVRRYLVSHP